MCRAKRGGAQPPSFAQSYNSSKPGSVTAPAAVSSDKKTKDGELKSMFSSWNPWGKKSGTSKSSAGLSLNSGVQTTNAEYKKPLMSEKGNEKGDDDEGDDEGSYKPPTL